MASALRGPTNVCYDSGHDVKTKDSELPEPARLWQKGHIVSSKQLIVSMQFANWANPIDR